MARDPSPLSQRLKALAVRAGLPVDTGAPAPAGPPTEDEQPTGEFPAVATSETPEEDRPTGEFPAITEVAPLAHAEATAQAEAEESGLTPAPASEADQPASDPEPDADAGLPTVPAPIWGNQPAPTPPPVRDEPAPPPPIWTDAPPESQQPPTAAVAPSDGPTLPPPTLSKPEQLDEALSLPDAEEESTVAEQHPAADLAPAGEGEAIDDAEPPTSVFGAVAIDGGGHGPDDAPTPATAPDPDEVAASTTSTVEAVEPSAEPVSAEPKPPMSARERLGLTGRFAALRRRVAPSADAPATDGPEPATADTSAAATPSPEPAPATPATPPAVVATSAPAELHAIKPSFSERAALRRRVKTLRARRDTGLLELGAIVLDQRRFGDPTAGALLRRRTDELGDLDNEIAAIEHALDDHASAAAVAALGAIRCVSCSSLVGPSDRFCAHCGTPRPSGGTPPSASSAEQAS